MILFCVIYNVFLFTTNKNMGEGLLKVTKIKLDKIEDTLKRIETFNGLLRKYRDKDNNKSLQYDEDAKKELAAATQEPQQTQGSSFERVISSSSISSSSFSNENKKHKELTILSYSYYQTFIMVVLLCATLIPMYVITYTMVDSTNQLIEVENFLFGTQCRPGNTMGEPSFSQSEIIVTEGIDIPCEAITNTMSCLQRDAIRNEDRVPRNVWKFGENTGFASFGINPRESKRFSRLHICYLKGFIISDFQG